jgi:hypothetical protein
MSLPTDQLIVPQARLDNGGEFMCPYTQDDVLAEWTDMAIKAKGAASIGGAIGAEVGSRALENIPIIGGILGQKVGEKAGRAIAVKNSGGWDFIKETSDISFDRLDDLAVYLYATFSTHEHYQDALDATRASYPKMKQAYGNAIQKSHKRWKKS